MVQCGIIYTTAAGKITLNAVKGALLTTSPTILDSHNYYVTIEFDAQFILPNISKITKMYTNVFSTELYIIKKKGDNRRLYLVSETNIELYFTSKQLFTFNLFKHNSDIMTVNNQRAFTPSIDKYIEINPSEIERKVKIPYLGNTFIYQDKQKIFSLEKNNYTYNAFSISVINRENSNFEKLEFYKINSGLEINLVYAIITNFGYYSKLIEIKETDTHFFFLVGKDSSSKNQTIEISPITGTSLTIASILEEVKSIPENAKSYNKIVFKEIITTGTTSERPETNYKGNTFYDEELKLPLYNDGVNYKTFDGVDIQVKRIGDTLSRPNKSQGIYIGFTYKDTDLNKWIIWNGEAWENIDGTALG